VSSFILHILFSGLIVFVPTDNGQEMDVLLLDAGSCSQARHLSDGSALQPHKPLLIATGGGCTGQCPTNDAEIAQFLFNDQATSTAIASLENAVGNGGAWILNGSDIVLRKGSTSAPDLPALSLVTNARASVNGVPLAIPTTSSEREDYSWVASFKQVCPTCTLDSDVLGSTPPPIVAARFKLRSGRFHTRSVARIGSNVTPVHFQRLDGQGSASSYSQAVATWVGADIEVDGDSIEIAESKFNGDPGRSMLLTPDSSGKIEIAVLNLPPFTPPATTSNPAPGVAKHFETYYDAMQNAPAPEERLVAFAGPAPTLGSYPSADWSLVHPATAVWSDLLNKLRLDIGRTAYDRTLCPPTNYP
jgi:hypothetical protein